MLPVKRSSPMTMFRPVHGSLSPTAILYALHNFSNTFLPLVHVWQTVASRSVSGVHSVSKTTKSAR